MSKKKADNYAVTQTGWNQPTGGTPVVIGFLEKNT